MEIVRRLLKCGLYAAVFVVGFLSSLYLTSKWIIQREPEITAPNLMGQDTVHALDVLTVLGLNLKVNGFEWSDTVPKNFIAFQDPPAGTLLKRDREVKVILSRGSRTVLVPKVVDTRLRETELVLVQNGLQPGDICRAPSSQYQKDTVIAQSPPPLREVERGRAVHLLMSDGPEPVAVAMPDVRLLPLAEAVEIIRRLELPPPAIEDVQRPEEPQDVILNQKPLAGYAVSRGQPIRLTLNRTPQRQDLPARLLMVAYVVPEGYLKREVSVYQQVDDKSVLIARGVHSPGERLQWLVLARSPEDLTIHVDGVPQVRAPLGLGGKGLRTPTSLGEGEGWPLAPAPWRAVEQPLQTLSQ
jgi:beta-lactam-binding protein with PASTA domain